MHEPQVTSNLQSAMPVIKAWITQPAQVCAEPHSLPLLSAPASPTGTTAGIVHWGKGP